MNLQPSVLRVWLPLLLVLGTLGWVAPAASSGQSSDFNRDGFADLAVGMPGESIGDIVGAGAVNVIYGSTAGLKATGAQLFSQASTGIPGVPENEPLLGGIVLSDNFGETLATGDFDGDGFADLAIGVPGEAVSGEHAGAGVVNVLYGSASGLTGSGAQVWHQGSSGVASDPEGSVVDPSLVSVGDRFGRALAAGDLNGDGRDDLAIGVPYEDTGIRREDGAVHVLFGAASGLSASGSQYWGQSSPGVLFGAEAGDRFGATLAIGNFGKSAQEDLAIGVPGEDVQTPDGDQREAGAINVLYGSATGTTAAGDQGWHQGSPGIAGKPEGRPDEPLGRLGDAFGSSLAAGNLTGDGRDDLAIGVPFEDTGNRRDDGEVDVLFGAANGLTAFGSQRWGQDSGGVQGSAESFDAFGMSLGVADVGRSAHGDLVIGAPYESLLPVPDVDLAGAVSVLYGSANGPTAVGDQLWHQGVSGVKDAPETGDFFGYQVYAADFGAGSRADLAVGAPSERYVSVAGSGLGSGAVNVLYGTRSNGLSATNDQLWPQGSPGENQAEAYDTFGAALVGSPLAQHRF